MKSDQSLKMLPNNLLRFPRLGLFILTAALLLMLPVTASAEYVSVQRDKVNVRSGPGTDHEIVWEVFRGYPLRITQRQGNWARVVDFEDDQGWIYTPLIDADKRVIVRVDVANMRKGPGTNYEVQAKVNYGVIFEPLERRQNWIRLRHNDGTTGWISASLLWPDDII